MSPRQPPSVAVSLLQWSASVLLAVPSLTLVCLLAPFTPGLAAAVYRGWARMTCRLFGVQIELEQAPPVQRRPALVVHLNQTSLIESLVYPLCIRQPFRLIVNVEFALLPLLGWVSVAGGSVVILRQSPPQARRAFERAQRALERGKLFAMSVEGRRSPDGALQPFKKGAAVLAIAAQADVVPAYFFGARDCLPFGEWRVRPGVVRVRFHTPLSTRGLRYEDRDALTAQLRALAEADAAEEAHRSANTGGPSGSGPVAGGALT